MGQLFKRVEGWLEEAVLAVAGAVVGVLGMLFGLVVIAVMAALFIKLAMFASS